MIVFAAKCFPGKIKNLNTYGSLKNIFNGCVLIYEKLLFNDMYLKNYSCENIRNNKK